MSETLKKVWKDIELIDKEVAIAGNTLRKDMGIDRWIGIANTLASLLLAKAQLINVLKGNWE